MKNKLEIKYLKTDLLIPYVNNARTHSDAQVSQIASSIKEFGFNNPILLDGDNGIVAGHGRLMGAKKLGLSDVPCIELSHLSEAQKKAYILADNKIALNAGWDDDLLKAELEELKTLDVDFSLMGFDKKELKSLSVGASKEGLTDPDDVPDVPDEPKTRLGDIYKLGNHRLMCGDSTDKECVEKLMNGNKADMVFTDPPYGIDIDFNEGYSKSSGNGVAKRQNYGTILSDKTTDVAAKAIGLCIELWKDAIHLYWGANYYEGLKPSKCWISWYKRDGLPSDTFCDTELAWTNAKKHCKTISVMWKGMIKEGETGQKRVHPTQKPILLAERVFDYLEAGTNIADVFGGSGSTLIACEKTNRNCYMMELDPKYCDVIVKRWEEFTGKKAELLK